MFEDGEAAQRALTDHYQRVAQVPADDPESYAPVVDADAHTAEVFWGAWIVGFGRAMGLRREAWDRIVQGDDLDAACANLMRVMYAFVKGKSGLSPEVTEELDRKAPRMIPEAVVDLNAWTKSPRWGAGRPGGASRRAWLVPVPTRDDSRMMDRNQPCPCGSGRKYTRCCAAHRGFGRRCGRHGRTNRGFRHRHAGPRRSWNRVDFDSLTGAGIDSHEPSRPIGNIPPTQGVEKIARALGARNAPMQEPSLIQLELAPRRCSAIRNPLRDAGFACGRGLVRLRRRDVGTAQLIDHRHARRWRNSERGG